jgi:hypothetical protein
VNYFVVLVIFVKNHVIFVSYVVCLMYVLIIDICDVYVMIM